MTEYETRDGKTISINASQICYEIDEEDEWKSICLSCGKVFSVKAKE